MCHFSVISFALVLFSFSFDLHGLILCVSEGVLSELLCIHIVGMDTFDLHGLIFCGYEGHFSVLLYNHILDTHIF